MSTINLPQNIVAFNGNIDFTEQIVILDGEAFGYRSKCEGKAISLYRNGELFADGVMSLTNADSGYMLPSTCGAELTYHDETFEKFSQDDTYTVVLGGEEPINMAFCDGKTLFTQEMYNGLIPFILGIDNNWYTVGNARTFSIAQNVQTTRKKYDIKLLPEECLPKSVAKKSEVKSVERVAQSAQSTAQSAQSTAQSAQSTAERVDHTAVKESTAGSYTIKSSYANAPYTSLHLADYSQNRYVSANLGENTALSIIISRDGGTNSDSTIKNPATIKLHNGEGAGGVIIDGLKSIIMTSSTPNSAKQFKITVDDAGTISATEVTA